MVHCIDIAGGSKGQASPGNDRMRRRSLNWHPPRKQSVARTSAPNLTQAARHAPVSSWRQSRCSVPSISNSWPY